MDTQTPKQRRKTATLHVLEPLRSLVAVSPSGAHAWLRKYTESDRELSFGCGSLTAIEYGQYWQAKLKAERPGLDNWERAIALLKAAGWQVA